MNSPLHGTSPSRQGTIARYLAGTGCALWLLVMVLQPDVGFSAPLHWMGLLWLLKIASGLALLQCVLYLLSRIQQFQTLPLWLLLTGSGIVGSALLTPLYWLLGEGLMQAVLGFQANLDDMDTLGTQAGFGWSALLQEFGELVGPVSASWMLISWPRLPGLLPPLMVLPDDLSTSKDATVPAPADSAAQAARSAWRDALPSELGDDIIAVSSELQYLRVWTSRGTALILGALQDVENAEGSAGIRVHRSWWVHAKHVRSVRRRGDALVCTMGDGLEVPVSRRRKADVLIRFGDTARFKSTSPSAP